METFCLQPKVAAASHGHPKEGTLKPCFGDNGHTVLDNQIPQAMLRLMQHELDGTLAPKNPFELVKQSGNQVCQTTDTHLVAHAMAFPFS